MKEVVGVSDCGTACGGQSLSSKEDGVIKRKGAFTLPFFHSRPMFIERDMMVVTAPPASVPSLRQNRRKMTTFPIKDDARYIGYLSDDDDDDDDIVRRRRRDLLGSDVSFSSCLLLFITVCGLLMLFIFAVSPLGVPPPKRL